MKLTLPKGIKRELGRIEEVYKSKIDRKVPLEEFLEFKKSLENGTNQILFYEEGGEGEAKIRLMHSMKKWFEPLSCYEVQQIENDVYVQRGLKSKLKKICFDSKTKAEAKSLLNFIKNARTEACGIEDENYSVKKFRIVESKKEFETILKKFRASEITELITDKGTRVPFTTIRVATVPMDYLEMYKVKGIEEKFEKFNEDSRVCKSYGCKFKVFNLWHDVRRTVIFYVYVPEE